MKNIDISNLKSALLSLEKSVQKLEENKTSDIADMIEDSCVKRFEYTLETSWKLMKKILKKVYGKNEEELSINNIFRYSQGYGFIQNWESWKMYYEKRNATAHEYNLQKSKKLLDILPQFIKDTNIFIKNLEKFDD